MKQRKLTDIAESIPCYAIYQDEYHHSDEWGDQLVKLWIETRKELVAGNIRPENFRDELIGGIINRADWRSAFNQAASEVGADPDDDVLFETYVALHKDRAFDLIPTNLHAEFCWVPEWDGANIDDMIETVGLKSERWRSNYLEEIEPDNWLKVFLQLVNQSSDEMIKAGIESFGEAGGKFAEKCAKAQFKFEKDTSKPSLMTGKQVIDAIENASVMAVPMYHCFVNVRALFELDPTKAMRMTSDKEGKVHLGLHDVINGSGYMDTYDGQIVIPANATGFGGVLRWSYGVDQVYGLVRSYFKTTPVAV